jgi:hypothetical protein
MGNIAAQKRYLVAMRLTVVRGFARHIASIDSKTEIPPNRIFPQRRRPKPYIYAAILILAF